MNNPTLSIPKPCEQNPSYMKHAEGGLFCEKCDHSVTDFTGWKTEDIVSYLKFRGQGNTCGLFLPEQLQQKNSVTPYRQKWFRYVALTILGIFGMKSSTPAQVADANKAVPPQQHPEKTDSVIYIVKGEVKFSDKRKREALVSVMDSTGQTITSTYTKEGKFELHIPSSGVKENYTIVFSSRNYRVYRMENFAPKANQVIGVQLKRKAGLKKKQPQHVLLGCPSF